MALPTYTKQWHTDIYPAIDASHPKLAAKDKRVVITGGAGGIGAATAEAFVIAGASQVVILSRTEKTLQATKISIESRHPHASIVPLVANVSEASSIASAFDAIAKRSPIDIFVNNAGYMGDLNSFASSSIANWWEAFEVNVLGSMLATQEVLKNISPEGVIINVSTAATNVPYIPGHGAYVSSKIGSWKFFEYIAHEHPTLRVFNLQPGIIESTSLATKAAEQSGIHWPQQDTVELPGNFMVWLASPEGAFLKGRFVWANWDVEELKAKKEELATDETMLTLGLLGWP